MGHRLRNDRVIISVVFTFRSERLKQIAQASDLLIWLANLILSIDCYLKTLLNWLSIAQRDEKKK